MRNRSLARNDRCSIGDAVRRLTHHDEAIRLTLGRREGVLKTLFIETVVEAVDHREVCHIRIGIDGVQTVRRRSKAHIHTDGAVLSGDKEGTCADHSHGIVLRTDGSFRDCDGDRIAFCAAQREHFIVSGQRVEAAKVQSALVVVRDRLILIVIIRRIDVQRIRSDLKAIVNSRIACGHIQIVEPKLGNDVRISFRTGTLKLSRHNRDIEREAEPGGLVSGTIEHVGVRRSCRQLKLDIVLLEMIIRIEVVCNNALSVRIEDIGCVIRRRKGDIENTVIGRDVVISKSYFVRIVFRAERRLFFHHELDLIGLRLIGHRRRVDDLKDIAIAVIRLNGNGRHGEVGDQTVTIDGNISAIGLDRVSGDDPACEALDEDVSGLIGGHRNAVNAIGVDNVGRSLRAVAFDKLADRSLIVIAEQQPAVAFGCLTCGIFRRDRIARLRSIQLQEVSKFFRNGNHAVGVADIGVCRHKLGIVVARSRVCLLIEDNRMKQTVAP